MNEVKVAKKIEIFCFVNQNDKAGWLITFQLKILAGYKSPSMLNTRIITQLAA